MIHFLITYTDDASDVPFFKELRRLGVEHAVFCKRIEQGYRRRVELYLKVWPRTLAFCIHAGLRSFRSSRAPDFIVVYSHLHLLMLLLLRAILARSESRLVLSGFIATPRKSKLHAALRKAYFGFVLRRAAVVICHSRHEVERYQGVYRDVNFVHVPYASYVSPVERLDSDEERLPYVFSAGRSGRDYPTLAAAARGLALQVRIVCDARGGMAELEREANVTVLSDCYGADYLRELVGSLLVVIPLHADDISAGQMVLVQAYYFGKPVIITRTRTTEEYMTDGLNGLFVEPGDPNALRAAIDLLRSDEGLQAKLAEGARKTYEERHSMHASVIGLLGALRIGRSAAREAK